MTLESIVCLFFIAISVGLLYLVLRKNSYPIPRGPLQWMVSVMCILVVCLSGLVIALTWSFDEHSHLEQIVTQAEPFEFQLVSTGETMSMSDFSGQVILLNFWATWCQPCITELPELDELQVVYRDRGLAVLTVSDEDLDALQLYTDLLPQETVSGYVEPDDLPQYYLDELAFGRPVTYVIDGEGTIRERIRGAGNFEYFEGLVTPWLAALES